MLTKKEPFNVKCQTCDHAWVAAYLPMNLTAIAKVLKGLRCPMCSQDSMKIFHK